LIRDCNSAEAMSETTGAAGSADKRAALLSLKNGGAGPGHVPAAFFLHFGEDALLGRRRSSGTSSTTVTRGWTS